MHLLTPCWSGTQPWLFDWFLIASSPLLPIFSLSSGYVASPGGSESPRIRGSMPRNTRQWETTTGDKYCFQVRPVSFPETFDWLLSKRVGLIQQGFLCNNARAWAFVSAPCEPGKTRNLLSQLLQFSLLWPFITILRPRLWHMCEAVPWLHPKNPGKCSLPSARGDPISLTEV